MHYRTRRPGRADRSTSSSPGTRGGLRRRQLDVEKLHAEGIRIVLPPAKEEDETEDGRLVDIHLPVNIIVRDALIRDVEIVRAGQPPFRLDQIALDARSERAERRAPGAQPAGRRPDLQPPGPGRPHPGRRLPRRPPGPGHLRRPPEYPPFVVAGGFNGTLEKLGVDARLTQPFDARVHGDVLTPMRELGMDLSAQVRGFEAKEINPDWPVARIRRATSDQGAARRLHLRGQGRRRLRGLRHAARPPTGWPARGEEFFFEYLNLKTENGADDLRPRARSRPAEDGAAPRPRRRLAPPRLAAPGARPRW